MPFAPFWVSLSQACCRLLRRVQRVLLADDSDAALKLLQSHVVSQLYQKASVALVSIVEAHKNLRAAFNEHLARDGWGVIQRGFQLMCELYRKKVIFQQLHLPFTEYAVQSTCRAGIANGYQPWAP